MKHEREKKYQPPAQPVEIHLSVWCGYHEIDILTSDRTRYTETIISGGPSHAHHAPASLFAAEFGRSNMLFLLCGESRGSCPTPQALGPIGSQTAGAVDTGDGPWIPSSTEFSAQEKGPK